MKFKSIATMSIALVSLGFVGFGARGLVANLSGGVTTVKADTMTKPDDPIHARQEMMETVGFATKTAGAMVKGKVPYDAKKAELAMRAINAVAYGFGHKFPVNSKTGGDTEAKEEIWSELDNFNHLIHEMEEHSEKAAKAASGGLEAFKVEFVNTVKYCKQCHKKYRDKKKK